MIDLELINEDELKVPELLQFESWLNLLAAKLKVNGDVCIKITSPQESQQLNHTYRGQNKPTNVLSFPADLPEFVGADSLGDLAICAAIVEQEATEQNKALDDHWAHMCIHGMLHLLGYDHIEDNEAEEMESLEKELLLALGIDDPYQVM